MADIPVMAKGALADNSPTSAKVQGFHSGILAGLTKLFYNATSMRLAAAVLVITAVLKVATVIALPRLEIVRDPVFVMLSESIVLKTVAVLELLVAAMITVSPLSRSAALALLCISGCFCFYRIGLWMVGYTGGCLCLGNPMAFTSLFKAYHGDFITLVSLCYVLLVSLCAIRSQLIKEEHQTY